MRRIAHVLDFADEDVIGTQCAKAIAIYKIEDAYYATSAICPGWVLTPWSKNRSMQGLGPRH